MFGLSGDRDGAVLFIENFAISMSPFSRRNDRCYNVRPCTRRVYSCFSARMRAHTDTHPRTHALTHALSLSLSFLSLSLSLSLSFFSSLPPSLPTPLSLPPSLSLSLSHTCPRALKRWEGGEKDRANAGEGANY